MTCHCGCNQPATRTFLPGHDQKLRFQLQHQVGGLLNLQTLIHQTEALLAGTLTPEVFHQAVAPLFAPAALD